jgi:ERCC4-type nuclease
MTKFLTAPTERPPFANLGPKNSLPERVGCDVVWEGRAGLAGAQRKAIPDLIASVREKTSSGPRLGRELEQMEKANLPYRFLIVEGIPQWDREGNMVGQHTKWTINHHNGVLLSVQLAGVMVLTSRNALETCQVVEYLWGWTQREEHVSSLIVRDKAPRNGWGRADDKTTFTHIFSAVDLISSEMSQRIFDMHGNILTLTVGEEELSKVPGLGPKRIKSILSTFGVTDAN